MSTKYVKHINPEIFNHSFGEEIESQENIQKTKKQIIKLERQFMRRQDGSKNQQRTLAEIEKKYERLKNQRLAAFRDKDKETRIAIRKWQKENGLRVTEW